MYTLRSTNFTLFLGFIAAWFPALSIVSGKSYNYSSIALLVFSFYVLWIKRTEVNNISPVVKIYALLLVCYFFSFALTYVFSDSGISTLDNPSKVLLSIVIIYAISKITVSIKSIAQGMLVGALVISIIASIYLIYFPSFRPFNGNAGHIWLKGYMEIQTAVVAAVISGICSYISIVHLKNKQKIKAIIYLIACMLAAYAVILSGSRGVWLGLFISWAYLILKNIKSLNFGSGLIIFTILLSSTYLSFQNREVEQRVEAIKNNIVDYASNKNSYTSIGIRFELWKSAILTFKDNPIIGAGKDGRVQSRIKQGKEGLISKRISKLTYHAHNQFLEALSVNGVIGLVALLSVFLFPLGVFIQKSRNSIGNKDKMIAEIGIISILIVMTCCLSQAYFNHNSGTLFYFSWIAILLSSLNKKLR